MENFEKPNWFHQKKILPTSYKLYIFNGPFCIFQKEETLDAFFVCAHCLLEKAHF